MVFARIINLESRPDRWKRLSQLGIQRFDAIRLTAPTALSLRAYCDSQHSRKSHEALHGLGANGCALSHIGVWKAFLESREEVCVVFEDDIQAVSLHPYIRQAEKDLQTSDITLLGWCGHLHAVWGNLRGNQVIPWPKSCGFVGAHAYAMTRKSAEILVKHALPLEMQVDYYIQARAAKESLRISITPLKKIRQVYTGSDVFTVCLMCEPLYPMLLGLVIAVLLMKSLRFWSLETVPPTVP